MNKTGKRLEYYLAGLVSALAFLVYLPALRGGFVWDDRAYIRQNPHLHPFNAALLKWAFIGFHKSQVCNWIPLTMVSYATDYALWGLDPMGYHLTNIILHAANTFIVVVLAVRLIEAWEAAAGPSGPGAGKKLTAAAITGLLFGLHPLHVESVAWASERKDVLCALFFLLGLLFYLRYALARLKYGPVRPQAPVPDSPAVTYLLSLFLFALALMSKPMAVSLPVVLLLLDWFPLGRIFSFKSFKAAFFEKVPFIVLSAADSVLTLMAQKGAIKLMGHEPLGTRLMVAARGLVLYLWKMVFPFDLVPYYPYPTHAALLSLRYLLPIACLAAITAFCLMAAKKGRKNGLSGSLSFFPACWGYFVATLLPVAGIVQVGGQAMADRYAYLPSLGPFLALGLAGAWAWEKAGGNKKWGRTLKTAAAAAVVLMSISMARLTFRQTGVWKNSLALWNYVVQKEPGKIIPVAYYDLAHALAKRGRSGLAVRDYETAIAMSPAYLEAHNNLGVLFLNMGRFRPALDEFNKSVLLDPRIAALYTNRGEAYKGLGLGLLAYADFKRACEMGQERGCLALRLRGP